MKKLLLFVLLLFSINTFSNPDTYMTTYSYQKSYDLVHWSAALPTNMIFITTYASSYVTFGNKKYFIKNVSNKYYEGNVELFDIVTTEGYVFTFMFRDKEIFLLVNYKTHYCLYKF